MTPPDIDLIEFGKICEIAEDNQRGLRKLDKDIDEINEKINKLDKELIKKVSVMNFMSALLGSIPAVIAAVYMFIRNQ